MNRLHNCSDCYWCTPITDSMGEVEYICANRYSDCFLQEVDLRADDCELDDFAERLWCEEHGKDYEESENEEEDNA